MDTSVNKYIYTYVIRHSFIHALYLKLHFIKIPYGFVIVTCSKRTKMVNDVATWCTFSICDMLQNHSARLNNLCTICFLNFEFGNVFVLINPINLELNFMLLHYTN